MNYKKFGSKYVVRIDRGEEVLESLTRIVEENNIKLGSVSGIGAADKVTLGLFSTNTKQYYSKELARDMEIANITGNISTKDGEPYLHLHITLADTEFNAYGGHLKSAVISATSELVIDEIDGEVDREFSEDIGLNLYKF
ncbi:MAG: DNA-binding protein [Clostridiales bacterium]|nr:DNA-binding protein [Clostridiales bacterium]MCF8023523.1 DNA-binding protein [Clostridiales bacterium]